MIVRNYHTEIMRPRRRPTAPQPAPKVARHKWWTKEEAETVAALRAKGLSFGRIAQKMPGRTRGAVAGFLHRMGRAA